MNKKLFLNKLAVKKSTIHGFGVFADKDFRKGEMIEQCYFITTNTEDEPIIDFIFEASKKKFALLFGYGSIYNHSDDPNTEYNFNLKRQIATFKTCRAIKKGEELFISYGDEWFTTRDDVKKKQAGTKKKKQAGKTKKKSKKRK